MPFQNQTIHVTVHNEAQGLLELELGPQSTCYTLKRMVAESWRVPPMCQKLTSRDEVLSDVDLLMDRCELEPELELTMIESHEELERCLTHEHSATRLSAVRFLLRVAQRDHARTVSAVHACLQDNNMGVRLAVVEVLAALASASLSGDATAVSMLVGYLEDRESDVRQAATEALARVVKGNDKPTLEAVRRYLVHWRGEVRRTAVRTLSLLAATASGDEPSVRALCGCLDDADAEVRSMVARTLPMVAAKGDAFVLKQLGDRFKNVSTDTRRLAVQVFAQMVGGVGEPDMQAMLLPCLQDSEAKVRLAAVEALVQVVPRGQIRAINAIGARLGVPPMPIPVVNTDEDSDNPDTEKMKVEFEALPEAEEDTDWMVRKAVVEALSRLAPLGDERIISAIATRLEDDSREVRRSAVEAVALLAPVGNRRALGKVAEYLEHPSPDMRLAAITAISHIAPKDDKNVIAALEEHISQAENLEVRQAALEALASVVRSGNVRVAKSVSECLDDPNANLRRTVVQVLPHILLGQEGKSASLTLQPVKKSSEILAGPEVEDLGLTFTSAPCDQPVVTKIRLASWAEEVGFEVGDEVIELNGSRPADMTPSGFIEALGERPLHFQLRQCTPQAHTDPGPDPVELREAIAQAIANRLKDRDERTRTAAARALALIGGEPAVRLQAMHTKSWIAT